MKRRFNKSSSFKMAVLFTVLLGFAFVLFFKSYVSVQHWAWGELGAAGLQDAVGQLSPLAIVWLSIGVLCLLLVIVISFLIAYYVVHQIGIMSDTALEIMETGDLSRRMKIQSRWDDLSFLAEVLNRMFTRIGELLDTVREVSDDIAHELRTPMTRLRNRLEELPAGQALSGEQKSKLLEEADAMLAIFSGLLRIARVQANTHTECLAPLDLACVARDAAEYYEPLAEEREVSLRLNARTALCFGDRDLLFQAVANLVDNALKFTPRGGTVTLTTTEASGGVRIEVCDTGEGIPESERALVFRRMYRSEKSQALPGHGLGLSLVKAIVSSHRGDVTLSDNQPGLRVEIVLPSFQAQGGGNVPCNS